MKYPKILYFIKGGLPSDEAKILADQYGPNTAFRNANFVSDVECLEKCDAVAGDVPSVYADAYPTAEEALKKFEETRKSKRKKAADNKNACEEAAKKVAKKAESDAVDAKSGDWKPDA